MAAGAECETIRAARRLTIKAVVRLQPAARPFPYVPPAPAKSPDLFSCV